MPSSLTIHNELLECIVVMTYYANDPVQVIPNSRTEVSRQGVTNIMVDETAGTPLKVHICRIGLFGLTSPRTRLTSGVGFALFGGGTYVVRATPRDSKGNLCSVHGFNPVDGTITDIASPASYRFGDKLLRPALRVVSGLSRLLFDAYVFDDHMRNVADREVQIPSPLTMTAEPPNVPLAPAVHIPEREIWGLFFEQTLHAGVAAYITQRYITEDDLAMQEPYLFIGLPSVALFNTVLRSASDPDGLVFIDGRRVTADTCVENFQTMFDLLMETKQRLNTTIALNETEKLWVKQFLLYAGSDKTTTSKCLQTVIPCLSMSRYHSSSLLLI